MASRAARPAGRRSSLGQCVFRSGLSKVGLPGATLGARAEDPTIAELLKPLGYATGQFGKNHFGDRDEHLAHDARLRRVLRQPLSPERGGGAREARLSADQRLPELPPELRSARRAALLGRRQGRTEDREHRAAHQEADGDRRRRVPGRAKEFITSSTRSGAPFFLGSTPRTCTSGRTPSRRARASPGAGSRSTTT